jgi:hypothetical protein
VNTLAPKHRDYFLTPFSKRDTVLTQRWPRLNHANDVPLRRIGIHAEEQVRDDRWKSSTHEIAQAALVHDAPELCRGGWNLNQRIVTAFGGSNEVLTGQIPQRPLDRHFSEGTTFAEFFKSSKLRDVEARPEPFACKLNGNLRGASIRVTGSITDLWHGNHAPKWFS